MRSHAQKFFLKLLKIEKERKKNLKKGLTIASRADQELIATLALYPLTADTPTEVLHFLRKEVPARASETSAGKDSAGER